MLQHFIGRDAFAGIFFHELQNQLQHRLGQVTGQLRIQRRPRILANGLFNFGIRRNAPYIKRMDPSEHNVQNDTNAPHIHGWCGKNITGATLVGKAFRRPVRSSAGRGSLLDRYLGYGGGGTGILVVVQIRFVRDHSTTKINHFDRAIQAILGGQQ